MNMLKREENAKYRETIRNTQEFDKDILKRFVNFMNNPDEETAVAQFGRGDKYFGVCTLMATMPGLPMFGHGQLEGLEEKYGMEYRRAYRDESPDRALVERHEREIFPLLKRRRLFSGVERFLFYDLVRPDGSVNENVFAYTNGEGDERALVAYNNAYARAEGVLRDSCYFAEKLADGRKRQARGSLAAALGLAAGGDGGRRFCVMREQRSELWFIRRAREIAEGGLKLILDGYQEPGLPRFLRGRGRRARPVLRGARRPGGAGAPDFSAAVQDVALKDLYATLYAVMTPELLAWARGLAAGLRAPGPATGAADAGAAQGARGRREAAPSSASVIKATRAPALAFYSATRGLLASRPPRRACQGTIRSRVANDARTTTRAGLRGGLARGQIRSRVANDARAIREEASEAISTGESEKLRAALARKEPPLPPKRRRPASSLRFLPSSRARRKPPRSSRPLRGARRAQRTRRPLYSSRGE